MSCTVPRMPEKVSSHEQYKPHKLRTLLLVIGGLVAGGILGAEVLPQVVHIFGAELNEWVGGGIGAVVGEEVGRRSASRLNEE